MLLCLLTVLTLFSTSNAQSRDAYVGVGGAYLVVLPLLSVQVGGAVSDLIELRATLDTLLLANVVGGDVLFTLFPEPALKVYLGAGPDLLFAPGYGGGFDFHGTAGVEYRTEDGFGPIGIYGEIKPYLGSIAQIGFPTLGFRGGVNFHF
jgi:hypothetical protein